MSNDRKLSSQWNDLTRAGAVPTQGKGTTAARAKRDEKRDRKRMPTEDRRRKTQIGPTLSLPLIRKLRKICKAEGYVGNDGNGIIASPVIEDLLWAAIEAYERGEFETKEVEVVEVQKRLRRRPRK